MVEPQRVPPLFTVSFTNEITDDHWLDLAFLMKRCHVKNFTELQEFVIFKLKWDGDAHLKDTGGTTRPDKPDTTTEPKEANREQLTKEWQTRIYTLRSKINQLEIDIETIKKTKKKYKDIARQQQESMEVFGKKEEAWQDQISVYKSALDRERELYDAEKVRWKEEKERLDGEIRQAAMGYQRPVVEPPLPDDNIYHTMQYREPNDYRERYPEERRRSDTGEVETADWESRYSDRSLRYDIRTDPQPHREQHNTARSTSISDKDYARNTKEEYRTRDRYDPHRESDIPSTSREPTRIDDKYRSEAREKSPLHSSYRRSRSLERHRSTSRGSGRSLSRSRRSRSPARRSPSPRRRSRSPYRDSSGYGNASSGKYYRYRSRSPVERGSNFSACRLCGNRYRKRSFSGREYTECLNCFQAKMKDRYDRSKVEDVKCEDPKNNDTPIRISSTDSSPKISTVWTDSPKC